MGPGHSLDGSAENLFHGRDPCRPAGGHNGQKKLQWLSQHRTSLAGGYSGTRKRDYAGVQKITMRLPF